MNRRQFIAASAAQPASLAAAPVRAASFRADATPPLGAPLIWTTPAARVADPLWAKGLVLESGGTRYALCAIDWCGISGSWHALLRQRIAAAVGASAQHVAVHTLHQHTAPYVCGDGIAVLEKIPGHPLLYPRAEFESMATRIAAAAGKAAAALRPVDQIGLGETSVDRVGSARRILDDKGEKVRAVRYSSTAKTPELADVPEGNIDRTLRTIAFLSGGRPLARLHYYATHPQTFCCEGTVTADFVGAAREAMEKEEGIPQIYFTGCSGDVTVGKYNDGSERARSALQDRLLQALRAAAKSTRPEQLASFRWTSVPLTLPVRDETDPLFAEQRAMLAAGAATPEIPLCRSAIAVAFSRRKTPLDVIAFFAGNTAVLHLPGEPMVEFQRFAQQTLPGRFVAVAGYGDIGPGYLCTDAAYRQGGYEPSASNVAPGTEAALKAAIRAALRIPATHS